LFGDQNLGEEMAWREKGWFLKKTRTDVVYSYYIYIYVRYLGTEGETKLSLKNAHTVVKYRMCY